MYNILRLNARTFPVLPEEEAILNPTEFRLFQVELPEECAVPDEIDGVMIVSAYLRTEAMRRFPRCRIISRLGNGCDKIDLAEAARRGIPITNVPDSFSAEVADHTMALVLALLRKVPQQDAMMRAGRRPDDVFGIRRLATLTLGIAGFGHIGRLVARRARAFGMKIAFFDPGVAAGTDDAEKVDFDTLLATSDVLALQCPLLASTREMMKLAQFRRMKPKAVFVNTARGELVCEADLAEALRSGAIAGAALDVFHAINVFTEGGFPTTHPFFGLPNLILTPHVAANSIEGRLETHRRGAQAVADFFHGKTLNHIVNRQALEDSSTCPKP